MTATGAATVMAHSSFFRRRSRPPGSQASPRVSGRALDPLLVTPGGRSHPPGQPPPDRELEEKRDHIGPPDPRGVAQDSRKPPVTRGWDGRGRSEPGYELDVDLDAGDWRRRRRGHGNDVVPFLWRTRDCGSGSRRRQGKNCRNHRDASPTRAANSSRPCPSSGCHCTPTVNRSPGTSIASINPSSALAEATSPVPSWSTA